MTPMPVILLLSGSLRKGSTNEAVLRTVQAVAPSVGVGTAMYEDLVRLPHFNPDDDTDPLPAQVAALRAALDRADAVLICTPEYAGTLPGSFGLDGRGNGDLRQAGRMDQRGRPGPWPGRGGHAADGARLHGRGRRGEGVCADPGGTGQLDGGGLVADPSVRRQLGEVLALLTRTAG
ncbi:NADPH-dependent FMN reductase [Streptomyces sp. CA-142005]|uniref:NADPH-dependent FMN reductase n=1 Tax=Streptomyces sp. CA-142005 TaxID=3240052 RepID=UPI003D93E748